LILDNFAWGTVELEEYLVTERKLAPASCRLLFNGIRFLYVQVLDWPPADLSIALPKRPQRIPHLLTLCYGCGLRLSELLAVKVSDVDRERELLRVDQGKGAKDRLLPLPDTLLEQLRAYWHLYHPRGWWFCGRVPGQALCLSSAQKLYTGVKARRGSPRSVASMHCVTPMPQTCWRRGCPCIGYSG